MVQKVWVFLWRTILQKKNGSKSMSFLCHTIWQKSVEKAWVFRAAPFWMKNMVQNLKKAWVFHATSILAGKISSKSMSFSCNDICSHLDSLKNFKFFELLRSCLKLGWKMVYRTCIPCATTFGGIGMVHMNGS